LRSFKKKEKNKKKINNNHPIFSQVINKVCQLQMRNKCKQKNLVKLAKTGNLNQLKIEIQIDHQLNNILRSNRWLLLILANG
jgi:ankyrin repeat protein